MAGLRHEMMSGKHRALACAEPGRGSKRCQGPDELSSAEDKLSGSRQFGARCFVASFWTAVKEFLERDIS